MRIRLQERISVHFPSSSKILDHFKLIAAAIFRNVWDVSEKDGLDAGSEDQQVSIKDFHSGSHQVGILGRMLLFTMPPIREKKQ